MIETTIEKASVNAHGYPLIESGWKPDPITDPNYKDRFFTKYCSNHCPDPECPGAATHTARVKQECGCARCIANIPAMIVQGAQCFTCNKVKILPVPPPPLS